MVPAPDNPLTGLTGAEVAPPPGVVVLDVENRPVPGVEVVFAVAEGGGTIADSVDLTDSLGIARVGSWRLGAVGTNTLIARAGALSATLSVDAASAYHIELRYVGGATARQQQAFERAVARWTEVITGDLPAVPISIGAGECGGVPHPAVTTTVDDVLVFVHLDSLDGVGGSLGLAGPCFLRSSGQLPIVGVVKLDTADLAQMEANGTLDEVVLHELGHVLGMGTVWETLELLVGKGGTDPYFSGTEAYGAFTAAGGTHPQGVPVENTGGQGTRDSHWRESVLGSELMTGFISSADNPLSAITILSLADMGYQVDARTADEFTISDGMAAARAAPPIQLKEVLLQDWRKVGSDGVVVD